MLRKNFSIPYSEPSDLSQRAQKILAPIDPWLFTRSGFIRLQFDPTVPRYQWKLVIFGRSLFANWKSTIFVGSIIYGWT